MITLMGITLSLSVIVLGALSAEISDIDITIPQERSNDLLSEFIHLKKAFGIALNYNLVDINFDPADILDPEYTGDIYGGSHNYPDISTIVDETSESFRGLELLHDKIFSASYESLDYSHVSPEGHVYYARIRLSLKDSTGLIVEPVVYSIICQEETIP